MTHRIKVLMIKDPCETCGSVTYYHYVVKVSIKGERLQFCNNCKQMAIPNLAPDVYFDPSKGRSQTDPNLCDRYTGPIPFSSKREKAAIMKHLGLREAGDKDHGSRNFDRAANKNNWK